MIEEESVGSLKESKIPLTFGHNSNAKFSNRNLNLKVEPKYIINDYENNYIYRLQQ